MSYQYNMPETPTGSGHSPKELYRPLPDKSNQEYTNQLFVGLFVPAKWAMFQRDGHVLGVPEDLTTFHFRIPIHMVDNYQRADGSFGKTMIVCPVKLTQYLSQLGMSNNWVCDPLFDRPRCAFCETAEQWWDVYNGEKLKHGYDSNKKISFDEARALCNVNPAARAAYETARKWTSNDRYIIQVFDHDKFSGRRTDPNGNNVSEFQMWTAPQSIYEQLKAQFNLGYHFFDTSDPAGVFLVHVTKDTRECHGTNLRNTKYRLGISPNKQPYDANILAYLNNWDARVDPSSFIPSMSYDEMLHYTGSQNVASPSVANQIPPSANVPMMTPGIPSGTVQAPAPQPTTQGFSAPTAAIPQTSVPTPTVPQIATPIPQPASVPQPVAEPVSPIPQPASVPQPAVNPAGPPIPVQPPPAMATPSVGAPTPIAPATVIPAAKEVPDRTPPAQQAAPNTVPDAPPAVAPGSAPASVPQIGPAPGKRDYTNPPAGGGSPTKMAW